MFKASFLSFSTKNRPNRESQNDYLRFNLILLSATFVSLALVGTINYLINPYGIFQNPIFQGINQIKSEKRDNDRLFKSADIIHIKPKSLIVGSSRVRQGIDPNNPVFSAFKPTYNLGLNGSSIHEQLAYLNHAITNQKNLKLVILETDLFMFNGFLKPQAAFSQERLDKTYLIPGDIVSSVFSWSGLSASLKTLSNSRQNKGNTDAKYYGNNGYMPYLNLDRNRTDARFRNSINQYLQFHSAYRLSPEQLNDFKKIVQLCKDRNIILKIYISPAHATQGEVVHLTGYDAVYEQWKRELVKIHPVWDFSGYNTITTEKLGNNMQNYSDNSHYLPPIGNMVLDRLFGIKNSKIPSDFGVYLTPENVNSRILETRVEREKWLRENPRSVEFVRSVKQKFDAKSPLP